MTDQGRELKLSLTRAEAGVTTAELQAAETIVGILEGFPAKAALGVLFNTSAMVICHLAKTKTAAFDESRHFRKEVDRCIEKNWHLFDGAE